MRITRSVIEYSIWDRSFTLGFVKGGRPRRAVWGRGKPKAGLGVQRRPGPPCGHTVPWDAPRREPQNAGDPVLWSSLDPRGQDCRLSKKVLARYSGDSP